MRKKKHKRCLVLNISFQALSVTSWKNAALQVYKNQSRPNKGLRLIEAYKHDYIELSSGHCCLPAVAQCTKYVNTSKRKVSFSKRHLFIRDKLTCQYCAKVFLPDKLEYDHVIPRAKWDKKDSPTNWQNIVTCCQPCNRRKADNLLKNSGMTLLHEPVEPSASQYIAGLSPWDDIEPEWYPYLTPLYKKVIELLENLEKSGV